MLKKKKMYLCIGIIILTYVCIASFEDMTILRKSEYKVNIVGDPPLTGKLYRMRDEKMLLVIYKNGTKDSESFSMDFSTGKVGNLGGGRRYRPRDFFGFGFVSNWIYEGYPLASELKTDVEIGKNGNIVLYVDGSSEEAMQLDHWGEQLLIYKRNIILSQ